MIQKFYDELIFQAVRNNNFRLLDFLFYKFPTLREKQIEQFTKNINEAELAEPTPEETQELFEKLCIKIREKYGDDAI